MAEATGGAALGPEGKGPKLSPTQQHFLGTRPHVLCLLRQEVARCLLQGPSAPMWGSTCPPPHLLPTSLFHCPLHKGLGGPAAPLPHPIPQGSGSMATATQTRRRLSASFISDIINHRSPQQHP